jgi:hypothetical protein
MPLLAMSEILAPIKGTLMVLASTKALALEKIYVQVATSGCESMTTFPTQNR